MLFRSLCSNANITRNIQPQTYFRFACTIDGFPYIKIGLCHNCEFIPSQRYNKYKKKHHVRVRIASAFLKTSKLHPNRLNQNQSLLFVYQSNIKRNYMYQLFAKTQYAGMTIHALIINLFRYLSVYWNTLIDLKSYEFVLI